MDIGLHRATYLGALLLVVLFGWRFRAWRAAAAAPLSAVAATALAEVAKDLIERPRPPHDLSIVSTSGFSMPSSIGAMTAAAATPVILIGIRMANRRGRLLVCVLVGVTGVVGVSMVYLGAHWLSDVLAGWALGAAVGTGVFRVLAGPLRPRPLG